MHDYHSYSKEFFSSFFIFLFFFLHFFSFFIIFLFFYLFLHFEIKMTKWHGTIQLNLQINTTYMTKTNHQLDHYPKVTQQPLWKCCLTTLGLGNKKMGLGHRIKWRVTTNENGQKHKRANKGEIIQIRAANLVNVAHKQTNASTILS